MSEKYRRSKRKNDSLALGSYVLTALVRGHGQTNQEGSWTSYLEGTFYFALEEENFAKGSWTD